jgi:hypothetical protein
VQVIEFPRDIVYPSEDVQLPFAVIHAVAISDRRQLPVILQPHEAEVTQAETPQIIQPAALVLPAENVETLVVISHRAADPRRGAIYIHPCLQLSLRVLPSKRRDIVFLAGWYS